MLSIADYVEEDVVVDDGGQCGTKKLANKMCVWYRAPLGHLSV